MRRRFPSLTVLFTAGVLTLFAGCGEDDPVPITGNYAGDYQITGYIGNDPFQVRDLVMANGGFVLVINRMQWEATPANRAAVLLNGTPVPINPFPLNTAEQAVYSLADIALAPGKTYELSVRIAGRNVQSSFQAPTTLTGVGITFAGIVIARVPPNPPLELGGVYVPGYKIDLRWQYAGGSAPDLVSIKAVDQFTGGFSSPVDLLDYQVTLDGTNTEHILSGSVTRYLDNDLRIWVSIPLDLSWTMTGSVPLFPGSAIHFIDAFDAATLLQVCVDRDDDGYGNPASSSCTYTLLDCDDDNASVNPGRTEGPVGTLSCEDGLDNNCNGLIDAEDEGCQVVPGGG